MATFGCLTTARSISRSERGRPRLAAWPAFGRSLVFVQHLLLASEAMRLLGTPHKRLCQRKGVVYSRFPRELHDPALLPFTIFVRGAALLERRYGFSHLKPSRVLLRVCCSCVPPTQRTHTHTPTHTPPHSHRCLLDDQSSSTRKRSRLGLASARCLSPATSRAAGREVGHCRWSAL